MALFQAYLVQGTAWRSVTLQDVRQNRRLPPRMGTEFGCKICILLRAASMKPKSLQTSVSKRGARAESFFGQPSGPLVFPSVLAKASQDSIFHTVQYWDGF